MCVKNVAFIVLLFTFFHGKSQTQLDALNQDSVRKKVFTSRVQFDALSGPYSIIPIFRTREDSVNNALLQLHLNAFRQFLSKEQADSVNNLMRGISVNMENLIGRRKVYRGSPGFERYSTLPLDRLKTATHVSLYQQKRIPGNLYACQKIEALELVNCSIKKLPRKFRKLNVKTIQFYDHQAKRGLKFTRNTSITKVINRGDDPGKIPNRIHKVKNLERLDFSSSGLTTMPAFIFKCKALKECILRQNKIDISHYAFPVNGNITKLDLSKNRITVVPSTMGNLRGLKVLQLNHNEIEKVEPGIGKLENLVELSFYQNKISSVPPDFYDLRRLVELDFYHNRLAGLDSAIANFTDIKILYLSYNNLVSVPSSIFKLSSLNELYLHNNKISALPDVDPDLRHLKILRLNNNYFLTLPSMIAKLTNLENLDFSYNNLQIIPNSLWDLKNLRLLSLVSNPWNEATKTILMEKAETLRQQNVIVNLSDLTAEEGH